MDPPWDCPAKLGYPILRDEDIINIPIKELQDNGFLLVWVTNAKL